MVATAGTCAVVGGGAAVAGAALGVGGLLLTPVTGGASLAGTALGLTVGAAAGLTIGTITISAAEIAILCGFTIAMTAMFKNYNKITFNANGNVTIEKTK